MKIAIWGMGHIGSWLAKELADHDIAVYDIDHNRIKDGNFKVLTKIEELRDFAPELFINAVSLEHTLTAFEQVEKYLPETCILVDVASVKGKIKDYYLNSPYRFVSLHPMFGPTFADMNAIQGENVVIIKESDRISAEFFRSLFRGFDITIFEFTFQEHDEMMAYSLTLPFVSSMVFAACMHGKAVPGTTFAKHMHIAKGLLSEDDSLLAEILFNSYSLTQLEKVTGRLEFLKHIIKGHDYEEASRFFNKLRSNVE